MITSMVNPLVGWIGFQRKIQLDFETEKYQIKIAENSHELEQVFRLRHRVFLEELQKKRNLFRVEFDRFDFKCDHVLIFERDPITKKRKQVVGCYRLLSSHFVKQFYSETEFYLDHFLQTPEPKLELGRACILPEHRNGAVIQLLWRGIVEYMKLTDSRYLMGCSSVQTIDPIEIAKVTHTVNQMKYTDDIYKIKPLPKYHPLNHDVDYGVLSNFENLPESPVELPPLLSSYLKAGAKLASLPAVDQAFQCIDFFTLLDRENLHPFFRRRYFGK